MAKKDSSQEVIDEVDSDNQSNDKQSLLSQTINSNKLQFSAKKNKESNKESDRANGSLPPPVKSMKNLE